MTSRWISERAGYIAHVGGQSHLCLWNRNWSAGNFYLHCMYAEKPQESVAEYFSLQKWMCFILLMNLSSTPMLDFVSVNQNGFWALSKAT